jgi:hypothetical protein
MKANCRRRRHSRHTVAQVTYSDLFLLAQWQSNSSHDSCVAAKAATSARLHLGADGDPDVHAASTLLSEEGKEEQRQWTAEVVAVAIYSSVIVVLLFLYVRYF